MVDIENGNFSGLDYCDLLRLIRAVADDNVKTSIENENSTDLGRSFCTSNTEVLGTLARLINIWEKWFPHIPYTDMVLKRMWESENTSGHDRIKEIKQIEEAKEFSPGEKMTPGGRDGLINIAILSVVCAFCVQALKAEKNSTFAWSYAIDAAHWLGIYQGFGAGGHGYKKAVSVFGKLGADAIHVENRAMKAQVHKWCDENMSSFKSLDAAAEAIAGKVVPVKFRTARDWVGDWKKLRSAGTP